MINLIDDVWWFIRYRIVAWFLDIPHKIRCYKLKARRGYSACDTFALYGVLAEQIYKGLKAFKKDSKDSYPAEIGSLEDWNNILDSMIFSFGALKNDLLDNYFLDDEKYIKLRDKIQLGLDLFAKYFQDLWW